ncbi:MAG: ABC transporter ATP-binding protein, partial [Candidatus Lindowbacteria bacterium]|nr:ABC transporter ATP-binding protein [Candidatus Lindowbacteria bacterium]
MELLSYFPFFQRLTERRLVIVATLAVLAVIFEGLGAAVFMSVMLLDASSSSGNFVTSTVYGIVDWLGIVSPDKRLITLLAFCCVAFFTGAAALVSSTWYSAALEARIRVRIQSELINGLFKSRYQYFLSHNIGFFNNAILNEMNKVSATFKFFVTILITALTAIMFFSVALLTNPFAIIVLTVLGVPVFFVFRKINSLAKNYSIRNTAEFGAVTGTVYQILSHFKYLKATNTFGRALRAFERQAWGLSNIIKKQNIINSLSFDGIKPFMFMGVAAVIAFVVIVMKKPVIEAVVMMGLLYAAYQRVLAVQATYQKFLQAVGGIQIYERLSDELAKEAEPTTVAKDVPDFSGALEFKNVSFSYRDAADAVLNGVTLRVASKSAVAFVGDSGSGKSTIVNLVTGLLAPTSGEILLNGTPYPTLDIEKLRGGIGYVTQEPVIFNDTVRNNLSLCNPE